MNEKELKEKIDIIFKSFDTKPVLFFGSGMSKRYYNLPNWKELLSYFSKYIDPDNAFAFQAIKNEASQYIQKKEYSNDYLYPYIATLLEEKFNKLFFNNNSFCKEIKDKYHNEIKSGLSPFKAAICEYLNDSILETSTLKNEIISLETLINKTSNIITTNYDNFLEKLFPNYKPLVGQDYIFNNSINSVGNIFEIHGSINQPKSLTITLDDYVNFNNRSKFLSAKLLTLFLEYPIIFLGYSINDANIKNILSDIQCCLTNETSKKLANRMIFIEYVNSVDEQNIIETEIEGIRMKKIKLFDYNILFDSFDNIIDSVDVSTLRLLEDKIIQLVQSSNNKIDRVYATGLENKELTSENLAVYIGHESSVFNVGYSAIRLINICEDILFQNKCYDPTGIIENTILSQKNMFSRSKIPLYKYINDYDKDLDSFYFKNNCIINNLNDIYNKQERKTRLYRYPITHLNQIVGTNDNLNKKIDNIYFSLRKLEIQDVKSYIKSIWPRKNELHSFTHLTKIVCVIDLIENKKEHR